MRINHDRLDNSSDDSSHEGDSNGLSADRVHVTSAHIPLREHVSVPMPPRPERAPLMPQLLNVEAMATELHVERQAPDPEKIHEADASELLYDRHIREERERQEQAEAAGTEEDTEDSS